ncbi:MAG: PAS domain-containing protein [Betaproteobacteria bacterium]|nr:PAS domain-containing protein [Betaproteobacteria bacterium]
MLDRSQQNEKIEFNPNGQLSQRLAYLENIINNSPDIFFVYNSHTARFTYCNSRVIDLLGYSCEEFQSIPLVGPDALIHSEDRYAFQTCIEQILSLAPINWANLWDAFAKSKVTGFG